MKLPKLTKVNAKGIPPHLSEGAILLGHTKDGTAKNPLFALCNGYCVTVKNGVGKMINPFAIRNWLKEQDKVEPIDDEIIGGFLTNLDIITDDTIKIFNSLIVNYPRGKADKKKITAEAQLVIAVHVLLSDMSYNNDERNKAIHFGLLYFKHYLDWLSKDSYVVRKA